ncbi:protein of unknown function [Shewanella benthica]|uniref:Uncharacterized protein n=1 Tax=Shewanella benthica TaxID=43661 RepID=A0A330M080_9GAMM|nr:protein of unknown function [Shewanella benthica]
MTPTDIFRDYELLIDSIISKNTRLKILGSNLMGPSKL